MGRIVVDTSRAPLLVVRYEGTVDDDAFAAYLAELHRFVERGERYAAVYDASECGVPSKVQRRMQAQALKDDRDRTARLCVGGAFVISSAPVRGALMAILWVQPLPYEHVTVANAAAAEAWALRRLTGVGLAA